MLNDPETLASIRKGFDDNTDTKFSVNSQCQALYRGDSQWYKAVITRKLSNGTYHVRFNDGTEQLNCTKDEVSSAIIGLPGHPTNPHLSNKQSIPPSFNGHDENQGGSKESDKNTL